MSILEKIERKCPWFGFPNLNLYLVVIFLIGLVMNIVRPEFYYYYLSLNINRVLAGEVWRLVTFIFYPPDFSISIIFTLIFIYVFYSITKTLVYMWGYFKFNLYMLIGYLSQIAGAFIIYLVLKQNVILYPTYTFFSIIMAFALTFPDAMFYFYFLIPIKAKYFAYIEIAFYIISFLSSGIAERVAIICSAVNVFLFFVLWKNKI